ncbi:MAG: YfhO family protein [Candidatus Pacebacteria bacterium]|nr:YfhO family protein [Candidatus Paceibacterota bacterium]
MIINKKTGLILLASVVMLVTLFIPQLFLNQAYSNGDALFAFYPALSFYANQISLGGNFLWSHSILSGFPTYLDLVGGFYSPVTHFIFSHWSVVAGYNLEIFFSTSLLFLFSYLFARQLKISQEGSLLVAISYSFGFHMGPWNNNITVVNAMFVLPMLLFCLAKVGEGKYWSILLGGVLTGYALISGQPQWVILGFVGGGLYVLFNAWKDIVSFKFSQKALILIGSILVMAVLGFLISAFQILPSQTITALSGRSGGLSFSAAQINSQTPFDWLWYLLPDLGFKYINGQEPTLYLGILPLILAIFAFFKTKGENEYSKFAIWLFVFGIIAAFKYSPLFWVIHQLPVFGFFRGSDRWMYIGNLGVAILAGIGLDALRVQISKDVISSLKKFLAWFGGFVVVSASVANVMFLIFSKRFEIFLYRYYDLHYYAQSTHLPLEHYHNSIKSLVDDIFWNISFLNIRFVLALLFILVGYLFLKNIQQSNKLSSRQVVFIISASFINLAVLNFNYYQIIPSALVESRPELASFISQNINMTNPERYFTVMPGPAVNEILRSPRVGEVTKGDQVEFERGMLVVNVGMQYGIDTIDGYNNLMPQRSAKMLSVLGSERTNMSGLADKKENVDDKLKEISSRLPLLSMLNVKYIVSAYELPSSSNLVLIHTALVTRFKIPMYLYENKLVLPRVYLANSIVGIPSDDDAAFLAITNQSNDFSKTTYLECADCQPNQPSPKDSIKINKYSDGFLGVSANIANGRWLVFSESNLPGWSVTIDGQPVESVMANYLFHGLYVPKGEHDIQFNYVGI